MTPRICIWTIFPNHYQAAFFSALRDAGVDLQVRYHERLAKDRVAMQWAEIDDLPVGEAYVDKSKGVASALSSVVDWRQCIHIVPGYGEAFLRSLMRHLSVAGVRWAHWSERSRQTWHGLLTLPLKRWYGAKVNRYALGAFGMGHLAFEDFARWGIRPEKMAFLPYVTSAIDGTVKPDEQCERFRRGRTAFLFLGGMSHRKGVDLLLKAFHLASPREEGAVLILAGSDQGGGRFQAQAQKLGLSNRVLFRGAVPPRGIASLLKPGCVMVLPSRRDGWGVVLNEGASAGLPLIATNRCGAAHHLIEMGLNGFRVQAGCKRSLAAALGVYVDQPSLIARHGAHSRIVAQGFTPEINARRFVGALESWLAMRGSGS